VRGTCVFLFNAINLFPSTRELTLIRMAKNEKGLAFFNGLKVVTNEKGEALGEVLTIIC
jgi:hypothetical protein